MYSCHALKIQAPSSLASNCTKVINDISHGIKRALSVAKTKSTFGRGGKVVRARSTIQNTYTGSVVIRIYVNGKYV